MRAKHWSTVAAAALLVAGCARPGNTPAGAPEPAPATVTIVASATAAARPALPAPALPAPARPAPALVSPAPAPGRPGEASCARGAKPMPSIDPSASFDVNDPKQRARRALAQQYRPTPRHGAVPEAAIPGAEACIYALKLEFSLLTSGSRSVPNEHAISAALTSVGLTKLVVRPGITFAASTGAACIHGTYTPMGPTFTIGPLTSDRSCRP